MIDDNDARYVDLIAYAMWPNLRTDQGLTQLMNTTIFIRLQKNLQFFAIEESGDSVNSFC